MSQLTLVEKLRNGEIPDRALPLLFAILMDKKDQDQTRRLRLLEQRFGCKSEAEANMLTEYEAFRNPEANQT